MTDADYERTRLLVKTVDNKFDDMCRRLKIVRTIEETIEALQKKDEEFEEIVVNTVPNNRSEWVNVDRMAFIRFLESEAQKNNAITEKLRDEIENRQV